MLANADDIIILYIARIYHYAHTISILYICYIILAFELKSTRNISISLIKKKFKKILKIKKNSFYRHFLRNIKSVIVYGEWIYKLANLRSRGKNSCVNVFFFFCRHGNYIQKCVNTTLLSVNCLDLWTVYVFFYFLTGAKEKITV